MQGLLLLLVRLPMQFAFTAEFRAAAWQNVTEKSETPIAQSYVHNKGRSLPLIPRASFIEVLFTTLEAQRLNLRGISTQTVLTNPIESAILRDVE